MKKKKGNKFDQILQLMWACLFSVANLSACLQRPICLDGCSDFSDLHLKAFFSSLSVFIISALRTSEVTHFRFVCSCSSVDLCLYLFTLWPNVLSKQHQEVCCFYSSKDFFVHFSKTARTTWCSVESALIKVKTSALNKKW